MVFMAKRQRYGKKPKGTFADRWIYTGLDDPQYIKDRNDFFRKHGNGWWYKGDTHTRKTNFTRK